MNNDIAIRVEDLSKKFCINQRRGMIYGAHDIFRSMVGFPKRRDILRDKEIWALRDVSFEVKRGEKLGIVGPNGAGKSTLLRVLSGIYPPDAGTISVRGSVGALIAANAGFHPDMTGRENIYLNGTIVGLKKKEIDRRLEEIVEFAEIGEFIDSPVRFYSSGMYVRLGFSIAANIRPRVLVIDEVLSVGDMTFQNKCFRKLKELRESVDAVLFVSHNLDHIRNICSRMLILDSGRVTYLGDVEEGIIHYQTHVIDAKKKSIDSEEKSRNLPGAFIFDSSEVTLGDIAIGSRMNENSGEISTGDDLVIKIKFSSEREIPNPQFSVGIVDDKSTLVIWQMDNDSGVYFKDLGACAHELKVVFKKPPLVPGVYRVAFALRDADSCEVLTKHKKNVSFVVRGEKISRGVVDCESSWMLNQENESKTV